MRFFLWGGGCHGLTPIHSLPLFFPSLSLILLYYKTRIRLAQVS